MDSENFNYKGMREIALDARVFRAAFNGNLIGIEWGSLECWVELLEKYVETCPESERGEVGYDLTYLFLDRKCSDRIEGILGRREIVDEELQKRYDTVADLISEWMRETLYEESVDGVTAREELKMRKDDTGVHNKVNEKTARYVAEKEANPAQFYWDFNDMRDPGRI